MERRSVNRHTRHELRRQLKESGGVGLVAVLLVAVSTTLGGGLMTARTWLEREVLSQGRDATIVAALRSAEEAAGLEAAFSSAFPAVSATVLAPRAVQEQLGSWFPELAAMLAGLPEASFPPLLQAVSDAEAEEGVARWLAARTEVTVVQSSRTWQRQVGELFGKLAWLGSLATLILLSGCCVVVLLVIRLLVLSHADEIAIMRLIGAHEAAIRKPYLACGATLGAAGGVIGGLLLAAMVLAVKPILPSLELAVRPLLLLPVTGGLVGLVGATIGLASLPQEP
jgi:cell division protein FtsX